MNAAALGSRSVEKTIRNLRASVHKLDVEDIKQLNFDSEKKPERIVTNMQQEAQNEKKVRPSTCKEGKRTKKLIDKDLIFRT